MSRGRWFGLGLLLLLVAPATLLLHTLQARPLRLDWLYLRIAWELRRHEPGSQVALPVWLERWAPAPGGLPDHSPQADEARHARAVRDLAHWSGYHCSDYADLQRESCEVLGYHLRMQVEGERWRLYSYPVNPLFGVQSNLPGQIIGGADYRRWDDADRAIARMQAAGAAVDGVLAGLEQRRAAGLTPPRLLVEHVLRELRAFIALPPARSVLMAGFRQRLGAIGVQPDDARRREREAAAQAAIESVVYPGWQRLIAHFESLQAEARSDHGAWAQPDGDAWYAYAVRLHTTTELTPQQVYALGQQQVAALSAEADAALQALGEREGSVGERLLRLAARSDQGFGQGSAARTALLNETRRVVARSRVMLEPYFERIGAAPVAVEPVPRSREASAPLAYYLSSRDGAGGVLYLNLRDPADLPRFALPTLAHHEAIPGHHLQGMVQRGLDLPAFRHELLLPAFAEGWAMYAERLAGEAMAEDPLQRLGRLQSELFRAARLVVDSGLHYQRWERERAVTYLQQTAGLGARDANAEVDRYLVYPGQALSFMIGMQRFLDARERARQQLGARFDYPSFHRAALGGGRLPLDLLDRRIDRYIAERGAQP